MKKIILPFVAVAAFAITSCSGGECNVKTAEDAAKCWCEVEKNKDKDKKGELKTKIEKKLEEGAYTENELEAKIEEVCD